MESLALENPDYTLEVERLNGYSFDRRWDDHKGLFPKHRNFHLATRAG